MPRRATRIDDVPNRDVLDDLSFGLYKAAVIKAAIELEVFTRMAEGHRTVPALARVCSTTERGIRILLDALVFSGLLSKQHSEYKLSPTAEAFLVKGKPSYYGDATIGDFAWDARGQLPKIIRTGKAIMPAAYSDAFEPTWAGVAASSLVDWQKQLEVANAMWDKIGITAENAKGLRVLDVACGAGVLSIALAKRHPSVRVTALDRAMVLPFTKQVAEAMGVTSQVNIVVGDALNLEVKPGAFDIVLFGNITSYFSPEQNVGAFRRAYEALVLNGRIVISAPVADEDHKGPSEVPIAGIEMLLFSPDGDIYTLTEYRGMLEAVGFSEVTAYKDDWGLVSARRIEIAPAKTDKG
ncbi:MAG: methyltransferase domain-containing protein [Chloroflexi bacterium]|nr:methyltransferase domain-containing protein [Chloroflexota bacterium]